MGSNNQSTTDATPRIIVSFAALSAETDVLFLPEGIFDRRRERKSKRQNVRADLLNTRKAAEHLGLSPRTLEDWRTKADATGKVHGPKVTRSGGRIYYLKADLDAFQTSESHLTAGQFRLKQQRRKIRRITSKKEV